MQSANVMDVFAIALANTALGHKLAPSRITHGPALFLLFSALIIVVLRPVISAHGVMILG